MKDERRPGLKGAASQNDQGEHTPTLVEQSPAADDGADILAALRDRRLRIRLDDKGQIRVGPRELVDDADRAILREHRDLVIAALAAEPIGVIAGGRPADSAASCGGRERL